MAFKIYNYENTLKFHRSALLNAVEKVNKKLKIFQDVLIIISTKNMIKTLPISIITGRNCLKRFLIFKFSIMDKANHKGYFFKYPLLDCYTRHVALRLLRLLLFAQ